MLYYNTLAEQSGESRDRLLQRDLNDLRRLLSDLLVKSDLDLDKIDAFSRSLDQRSKLDAIEEAFDIATDPDLQFDLAEKLDDFINALRDPAFVESEEYAAALCDDFDKRAYRPLAEAMITSGLMKMKHRHLMTKLWLGMATVDKSSVTSELGAALDREIPDGNWLPHILMLRAFGKECWEMLRRRIRIRLENAIAADILNGYTDGYSPTSGKRGQLGKASIAFFSWFVNPDKVIDNLVQQLSPNWYTQNYFGQHFIPGVAKIGLKKKDRNRIVQAIRSGLSNKPFILQQRIALLPPDWRKEIERPE